MLQFIGNGVGVKFRSTSFIEVAGDEQSPPCGSLESHSCDTVEGLLFENL